MFIKLFYFLFCFITFWKNQMKNKNNIRNAFSFIWLVFFPFVVSWLLSDKSEYELSEDDVKFIRSYQKVGWFDIFFAILAMVLFFLSFYLNLSILSFIAELIIFLVFLNILVHIFFIYSNKYPLFTQKAKLNFVTLERWSSSYFFYYLPFVNYYIWLKYAFLWEKLEWVEVLKESNLIYFILFLLWLLVYFFPSFIYVFYLVLILIVVKVLWLFFWINFKWINLTNLFSKFPYEILAYIEWFFYFLLKNLFFILKWKQVIPYHKYVSQIKLYYSNWYDLNLTLKKFKKYLFLHLSYLILISFFGYVIFDTINGFYNIIVICFWVLWLLYIFVLPLVLLKKVFPLPFISLLLYTILKKF